LVLFIAAVFCLGSFSLFPILVLESVTVRKQRGGDAASDHLSPGNLVANHAVQRVREQHARKQRADVIMAKVNEEDEAGHGQQAGVALLKHAVVEDRIAVQVKEDEVGHGQQAVAPPLKHAVEVAVPVKKVPLYKLEDLKSDSEFRNMQVARGVAGRPEGITPAVVGAKRAHIECEINVDSLAYWNNPQGTRDDEFVSPFRVSDPDRYYMTFNPDKGGALTCPLHFACQWMLPL
jgi:hypothetical protein